MREASTIVALALGLLAWWWIATRGDRVRRRALAALSAARRDVEAQEPDAWINDDAFLSAEKVETVARKYLEGADIEVDLVGTTMGLAGGTTVAKVMLRWSWGGWSSEPTIIDTPMENGKPGATQAAITSARKVYLRNLLGIRQSADPAAELGRAADIARVSVREAASVLLEKYSRSRRRLPSQVIRVAVASRAKQMHPPSVEELGSIEVAYLFWWLTMATDSATADQFEQGVLPAGMFGGAEGSIPF